MRIAVIIATRKGSKRVKNKSLKKFGKYNLTTLKLHQALKIGSFHNYYFSSDIKSLNEYAKKLGYTLIKRPKKFLGDATISDFAPYLKEFVSEEHFCYLTNTSPLLNDSTIRKAIKIYKNLNIKKNDSLSTFESCHDFMWNEKSSINYKVNNQPKSQNLKKLYKFNPALSIIPTDLIGKVKNVIGYKPYKLVIRKPESIDIDTIYDYELAKLYKIPKKNASVK